MKISNKKDGRGVGVRIVKVVDHFQKNRRGFGADGGVHVFSVGKDGRCCG